LKVQVMKKEILKMFFLFVIPAVLFTGCGSKKNVETSGLKISVSIPTYKGITERIGGTKTDVVCLLRPGINPEEFDPSPDILKSAAGSDLYIRVGDFFDFENIWLGKITALNKELKIFDSSTGINEIDHNHHVWNGTGEVKIIAKNIYEKLKTIDPENADYYSINYKKYISDVDSVDEYVKEKLSGLKIKTILTYHPAWTYFAASYGLDQISIEDHGKMPRTKDLTKLVNKAKDLGLKAIFVQPQFDNNTARIIAGEIGAKLIEIDPLPENFLTNLVDIADKIEKYNE
jgi:zinc transport system substrate-binding protein